MGLIARTILNVTKSKVIFNFGATSQKLRFSTNSVLAGKTKAKLYLNKMYNAFNF